MEEKAKYFLSEEQVRIVKEAQEQILNGEFLTEEEADKEIDQWLNEQ